MSCPACGDHLGDVHCLQCHRAAEISTALGISNGYPPLASVLSDLEEAQ